MTDVDPALLRSLSQDHAATDASLTDDDLWLRRAYRRHKIATRTAVSTQPPISPAPEPRPWKHDWRKTGVACSAYCFVDHDLARSRARVKKYGVAAADLDILIENVGGLCMICRRCHASIIEHDHPTRLVRGIVCVECNRRIALIEPTRGRPLPHEFCQCQQSLPPGTLENRVYAYLDHAQDFAHLTRRAAFAALASDPWPGI